MLRTLKKKFMQDVLQ